jgi:hypothetical protein
MKKINTFFLFSGLVFTLTGCTNFNADNDDMLQGQTRQAVNNNAIYSDRLPAKISSPGKTIVVDPRVHAWGAYSDGNLVRSGLATSGGNYCPDVGRSCRTVSGSFRIYKLGSFECRSKTYPVGKGGALMPYCMFFSGGYSLHGSTEMAEDNVSHGCVRMTIPDAEWVRYQFASVGTRVIVKPY